MIRALGTLLVTLIACTSCAEKAHDTSVSAQATPSETSEVQPPLTHGEQKLIRSQIAKNWVIDIGMEGLEEMAADIVVEMNPNGTVQSARAEPATDNGHPNWKYFSQSCVRAVRIELAADPSGLANR